MISKWNPVTFIYVKCIELYKPVWYFVVTRNTLFSLLLTCEI